MKHHALLADYDIGAAIHLGGKIVEQLFFYEETTYGVYRYEAIDQRKMSCIITGLFPYELLANTCYHIYGMVSTYKGEKQIVVEAIYIKEPTTEAELIACLKQIKGINTLAKQIVNQYGLNTISYCMDYPANVAQQVKGVHEKLALQLSMQLQLRFERVNIREQLIRWGFSAKQSESIVKRLGQAALLQVRQNPYQLIELIDGIGFKTIDKLAVQFGFDLLSEERIKAAISYSFMQASRQGHCYMTLSNVSQYVQHLIAITLTPYECAALLAKAAQKKQLKIERDGASYLISKSELIGFMASYDAEHDDVKRESMCYTVDGFSDEKISNLVDELVELGVIVEHRGRLYLQHYYRAELKLAYKLIQLMLNEGQPLKSEHMIEQTIKALDVKLEEKQLEAVRLFSAHTGGFMILNGSAGCGKTFTLNIILKVLEKVYANNGQVLRINIMAPTGKAAQVASLATKREATTIHRGLRWQPDGFQFNEKTPLPCDVLVVDESSMLDIQLAYQLSKAISDQCKVIFMGDTKQLQSVGAGNVFHDLIRTGLVPIVTLDVIKRQAKHSGIVDNASRIINYEMIRSEQEKGDSFVLLSSTTEQAVQLLLKGMHKLVSSNRFSLSDIQVLSPMRKGLAGVDYLNYILQQTFNHCEGESYENKTITLVDDSNIEEQNTHYKLDFFSGDKVIHLVNDYTMPWYKFVDGQYESLDKLGITNGECGVIAAIGRMHSERGHEQVRVTVKYDEGYVHYINPGTELDHAYAMTIHKSQGSQWPAVFMPIVQEQKAMLTNSLIYTGFTRAKQFQCIIGQKEAIAYGIKHDTMEKRRTSLHEFFGVEL